MMLDNKSVSSKIRNIIIYAIVILCGILCLIPLWSIVAISLSGNAPVAANKVLLVPIDFTVLAYEEILTDAQFWISFRRSVFRVFATLILNLVLIVPMAYGATKTVKQFKFRNVYMNLLIFAMLFNGGMVPNFIWIKELGLLNNVWALILPAAVPIFSVILMMNFFKGIPYSLEEAAMIDGATPYQILLKVMVPCSLPSLATVSLFSIVNSWNEFFNGKLYMQKVQYYPIMTYIQSLTIDIGAIMEQGGTMDESLLDMLSKLGNKNLNCAKIVIAIIPLLMIYPLCQRYLISGMVMGSVKE